MSKAEKTKQFIIEKTATLFNTKGYTATSLSDITEATGLTKGSIYGNFENKDEVSLEVYKYNSGVLKKSLMRSFSEEFPTMYDKLYAFVAFYRKNWQLVFLHGGCPLMNAATESDDTFPALNSQVKISFQDWTETISKIIKAGKLNNEFNQEIDPEQYASLFIILIEGGILLSKTTGDEKHLNLALDRIQILIDKEIKKNPL
ncbi:TetR/AcrR family transcriptional regulator [Chryseobacterium sp. Ch-15]|uniref:TetR/AcrR family transcriptional regulator n=1 Tax=Chryseobacterium muglaense TaxID=2893752 RepID=A0A9Q3USV1_9FLAO|nr:MULTISPECIES: TetR/AcrR family transcriptional regulator [Chryseobacterium]MBD3905530.1 TetR/AcrR family transcriptional regulator [Chryseobacterium muglaense]MBO6183988.1 TetR/AcrR family transcriptional regulator [Chryseobacterium sp.]MCC9034993.1 TetR/AcrR family transcriptional regulator [Chryseobacterium muglaense]MCM2555566.1 TetR/AcrR family transcriptional regulator [Chryseobacterium muglaense]